MRGLREVLDARERRALAALLGELRRPTAPPLLRGAIFGSKARGDWDRHSDVDVLLVCDVPPLLRSEAGEAVAALAGAISRRHGVRLEPWVVCRDDLRQGRRTPMLVDAVADAVWVWPPGAPPLRAPFTPADALFCAGRLLQWVDEGGEVAARALREGAPAAAAARARDDCTRMATAALLLAGDTRHRRRGSLRRFEERFVASGLVSERVRPALRWSAAAYPPDGGRGLQPPPVPPQAVARAREGCRLAAVLERELLPLLRERAAVLRYLIERDSVARAAPGRRASSMRNMPRFCAIST